jgi:acetyltransferase-like isoleucine patch superfamily enzyme
MGKFYKIIKINIYIFASIILHSILFLTPINSLRVLIWKICGLKVGKNTYISNRVKIDFPWRVTIGKFTYINSGVYLDGRGGDIIICDKVDISENAKIYTLTHDIYSDDFKIKKGKVVIEDFVWICVDSIVLPNSVLSKGVVLSALSVFKGKSNSYTLYSGNHAIEVKKLPFTRSNNIQR